MGVSPPPPPPGMPPPPPPPPGPTGPPAWPFIVGGVVVVAIAVAAVFVFLDPLGDDGGGDGDRSVPEGAVAVVGDEEISRDDFDHWLASAAKSEQGGGEDVVVPDPPEFQRCIRARDLGGSNKSRDDLEEECRNEYEGLRDQVMQFLVSGVWIELEAEERGIEVDDAEVRRAFEDQKDQSFQRERDYQEFLRTSGQTEADLLFRVRLDLLSNEVRAEVTRESGEADDQKALDEFVADFQERYRDMTVCAEGFVTKECSNGPPLTPQTGTTTTIPAPTTPDE